MRYVKARAAESTELVTYRFYISSAVKVIADNSTGDEKKALAYTYDEFRQKVRVTETKETRTGQEIAEHMKELLRKLGGENRESNGLVCGD